MMTVTCPKCQHEFEPEKPEPYKAPKDEPKKEWKLSKRSLSNLEGVHPHLVRIVEEALKISEIDFMVIEGSRSVERQKELLKEGKSTTMRSRHIPGGNGYAHAVDIVPLRGRRIPWESWDDFALVAKAMKAAAKKMFLPLEWGGDWRTFKDGPHYQLPWLQYPHDKPVD